jgi:hypothetical protein
MFFFALIELGVAEVGIKSGENSVKCKMVVELII